MPWCEPGWTLADEAYGNVVTNEMETAGISDLAFSTNGAQRLVSCLFIGRGDWIRTNDPLLPKQVRYQAALRPEPNW